MKLQPRKNLLEMQHRAATANFNIVGMGAQTEQLDGVIASLGEMQTNQATSPAAGWPFFHRYHGGAP